MSDQQILTIKVLEKAVVATVQCTEFDHDNAVRLHQEVTQAASTYPALPLLLEMSAVEFVPSVALGVLLKLAGEFKTSRRRLVLVGLSPEILKIMEMTAIHNLFEIQKSVDEAVKYRFGVRQI